MSRDRRLDAVVWALAAHRATRLVTADTVTRAPRDALVRRSYIAAGKFGADEAAPEGGWSLYAEQDDEAPYLATLVTCRWCTSVWLVGGLLLVAWLFPRPARVLRWLLAGSSAAVLLARIEE